jgi:hypothetical protein
MEGSVIWEVSRRFGRASSHIHCWIVSQTGVLLGSLFNPKSGSDMILRNVCSYLSDRTELCTIRQNSSGQKCRLAWCYGVAYAEFGETGSDGRDWLLSCYGKPTPVEGTVLLRRTALRIAGCGAQVSSTTIWTVDGLTTCKVWGFHGGDYEGCCHLGCNAVWLLLELTLLGNVSPSTLGWKEWAS